MRLDVWLDVACLFRTRSEAQAACRGGKVDVNGNAAKPNRLVRPGDELRIYGAAITNGVHYYLGLNEPALDPYVLPLFLERTDRPGRLFLATNDAYAAELLREWPGRFDVVARLRQGRKTSSEHVLLALRK